MLITLSLPLSPSLSLSTSPHPFLCLFLLRLLFSLCSVVIDGMLLEVNDRSSFSGGEIVMNDTLIEIALNSSGYIVREHPGYAPR